MKFLLFVFFGIMLVRCNNTPEKQENAIRKKHLFFSGDSTYKIKIGSTVAFEYSETEGIDRSRFPSPSYGRELDTAYFKFVEKESFYPEECAGCATRYYSIFKAIQKGTTLIKETKTTYQQNANQIPPLKDTMVVIGEYHLIIE